MTSQILTQLLQALSLLSVLLLLGVFLRAKVKLFQKLYLPASVIGGFIGLLISPEILGRLSSISISEEYIKTYSLLPGILSVPIFAAVPLGMFLNEKKNIKSLYPTKVLIAFGIFQCASMLQSAIGYATNMLFTKISPEIGMYRTFGYELSAGFAGGHGLAAATGKLLEGFGIPQIISTERPDKCTKYLLQGRVVVLVNGNPYAIVMPATIEDFLFSPEDTNLRPLFSNFLRGIRVISAILTLLLPGIYIAITSFSSKTHTFVDIISEWQK